jgi:hypothetical protein
MNKYKKNSDGIVNFRLDQEVKVFLAKEANKKGVSLSVYLRELIMTGYVGDSMGEMKKTLSEFVGNLNKSVSEKQDGGYDGLKNGLSERFLYSVAYQEMLLSILFASNNPSGMIQARSQAEQLVKEFRFGDSKENPLN